MQTRTVSSRVLILMWGAIIAACIAPFGLPAIASDVAESYEIGLPMLGAVLSAPLIGSAVFQVPAGAAIDRYGVRKPLLLSTTLLATSLCVAAFSTSVAGLVLALLGAGSASAVSRVATYTVVLHGFPASSRRFAFGLRETGVYVGGMVAAVVLPLVTLAGGVRLALVFAAVCCGATGYALAIAIDPNSREARPVSARTPMREMFALAGMRRVLVLPALCVAPSQAAFIYAVPAARDAGLSPFAASTAYFCVYLAAAAAGLLLGRLADHRVGKQRARILTLAGATACVGGLMLATVPRHAGAVICLTAVFAFGACGWPAFLTATAAEQVPAAYAARAMALVSMLVIALAAVITPCLGWVAAEIGWAGLWVCVAAIAGMGALVARGLEESDTKFLLKMPQ